MWRILREIQNTSLKPSIPQTGTPSEKILIFTPFLISHSMIQFFELWVEDINPFEETEGSTREQQVVALQIWIKL